MMHIKKAGASVVTRPLRSFTFIDAVSRFSKVLSKDELSGAYDRAGVAFKGQLEQTFVVLNDEDQSESQRVGSSKPWSGDKGPKGPKGPPRGRTTPGGSSHTSPGTRGTKRSGPDLGGYKPKSKK
jgi:hypothetical protein